MKGKILFSNLLHDIRMPDPQPAFIKRHGFAGRRTRNRENRKNCKDDGGKTGAEGEEKDLNNLAMPADLRLGMSSCSIYSGF